MILTKRELQELFYSSIDNAYNLFEAAKKIAFTTDSIMYPSLGLAELALEELGKSYTCLAYYSQSEKKEVWPAFWKEWKDHNLKAHRGFFYEFFCLTRIEIVDPSQNYFPSLRKKIPNEKEFSFYVDIDKGSRKNTCSSK